MKHQINTKYCNELVRFKWSTYASGQHALQLFSPYGSEMTVTSNMPDHDIAKDEIVVKNYSENEGILAELIRLKIIAQPSVRQIRSGFVTLEVCKLLIDPTEQ